MREIRRKDRVLEQAAAEKLIATAEYGVLSMVNVDGGGYGIPLSYAVAENGDIYFHCAPEGHKLDNLSADNRVTFTIVGNTEIIPQKFTTLYSSVLIYGHMECELTDQEREEALWLIVKKYSPEHINVAEKYIKGSFHRTNVIKLKVHHYTEKTKQ